LIELQSCGAGVGAGLSDIAPPGDAKFSVRP
jgi:hypothetical protein